MNVKFTYHALHERINDRLKDLVTADEVLSAIERAILKAGENYIDVKFFSKRIYLGDPRNEATPKGDKITAKVINDGTTAKVITVMLRKSTSVSARYA
jgi:hypothetical protein